MDSNVHDHNNSADSHACDYWSSGTLRGCCSHWNNLYDLFIFLNNERFLGISLFVPDFPPICLSDDISEDERYKTCRQSLRKPAFIQESSNQSVRTITVKHNTQFISFCVSWINEFQLKEHSTQLYTVEQKSKYKTPYFIMEYLRQGTQSENGKDWSDNVLSIWYLIE